VSRHIPEGYERLDVPGSYVVAHRKLAATVRATLEGHATLYAWAAAQPGRRELQGRLPVYAAALPGEGPRVVVRHAHRGGWLAPLLGDRFLLPLRPLREVKTALILAQLGIPTPPVAAYAIYPDSGWIRRVDVMTIELPGDDLGAALRRAETPADRQQLVGPVATLLGAMSQGGAWHPDLNVKNILIVPDDAGQLQPAVLDVDRMRFVPPGDPNAREANLQRLMRSSEKWHRLHGAGFAPEDIQEIRDRLSRDEAVRAAHRALAMEAYMP